MKPKEKGIQTMLDFTNNTMINNKFKLPSHLDFGVKYEPTRFNKSKYVINTSTDEVLGVVGNSFTCASHPDFYDGVFGCITKQFSEHDINNATIDFRTAQNGAWSMLDITFPTNKRVITTKKHKTEVAQRVIALHSVNASTSNRVWGGLIDFFCLNKTVTGDYASLMRKNTSGFSLEDFIIQLNKTQSDFMAQADLMQSWADTEFNTFQVEGVKDLLDDIVTSKSKSEKLFNLFMEETATRGFNKMALASAFSNYSSYADERNGFALRSNGNDTQAVSMWQRESEVAKLVTNKKFLQYAVAA